MADPITMMAGGSMAASLIGGVVGAVGAKLSADASSQAFLAKVGIANVNAKIEEQNVAWALSSGGTKAMEYGLKAGEEIGGTKVAQSGSGFDVNSGSASAVRDSQGRVAKFDQDIIAADAAHVAYGHEVSAAKDTYEASLDVASAENAQKAGTLAEISSILGGVSSVSSKWTQGKAIGIGSGSSSVGDPSM